MKNWMSALAASALIAACALGSPVLAQQYPAQPVKLIVAFGPGGGTDIVSRIVAQRLQDKIGQPVVIENRPGAGGTVGNDVVARAPADGYTLGMMTAGQIIAAVMRKQMPYDTLKAFDAIGQVATAGLIIVAHPDFPASDVKGLVELAKAKPGKVSIAAPGFGATQHMASVLFAQTANIDVLQVPFKTTPDAMAAVLSRQVDILFDTVSAAIGSVEGGKLKALAVTGKDRFPAVPNIPAAIESGVVPNYDVTTWYGMFGPRGMPPAVAAKLNKALNEVLAEPEVRDRLTKAGVVVKSSTPEEFASHLAAEHAQWTAVRDKAGLPQQ
jgi:tripartite-type tricarboxylate transporter receptor subunit TctC